MVTWCNVLSRVAPLQQSKKREGDFARRGGEMEGRESTVAWEEVDGCEDGRDGREDGRDGGKRDASKRVSCATSVSDDDNMSTTAMSQLRSPQSSPQPLRHTPHTPHTPHSQAHRPYVQPHSPQLLSSMSTTRGSHASDTNGVSHTSHAAVSCTSSPAAQFSRVERCASCLLLCSFLFRQLS